MDDEQLPPPKLGNASKNTTFPKDDAMSSSSTNPANKLAPPGPRRSARATKFDNPYGYLEGKISVEDLLGHPIERTGRGTLDKSKFKLRKITKSYNGLRAEVTAEFEAWQRACQSSNAPPRAPIDPGTFAKSRRQMEATMFRNRYTYGPNKDEKTCIWSAGGRHSWSELSSGITWIAVHGVDQICVVSRRIPAVDPARLSDSFKQESKVRHWLRFMYTVTAEMEDTTGEFFQKIDESSKTSPFAVVSVVPGSSSKASTAASGEGQSVDFLAETLRNGTALSPNETAAISALQYLFCQKFKSNEIVAYMLERSTDGLGLMFDEQVADHLAAIEMS